MAGTSCDKDTKENILTHNIGDVVACYANYEKTQIVVGLIVDSGYESIWVPGSEIKQPCYKVEWCDDTSISNFLHTEHDIQDMKDLYDEWNRKS